MEKNAHIFIGKPRGNHRVVCEFIYFLMHTSESFPPWNNNISFGAYRMSFLECKNNIKFPPFP